MKHINHTHTRIHSLHLTVLAATLLTFFLFPSLAHAYSGGSGTPADPFQIATVKDLIDLGKNTDDYDRSFVLCADLDFAGRVFDRAVVAPDNGRDCFPVRYGPSFTGRFDGQGHVIRNLHIEDRQGNCQGLFGMLSAEAEITRLSLENVRISGFHCIGGLAGYSRDADISACSSVGMVRGARYAGGLVGENRSSTITSCHSAGAVNGDETFAGVGDSSDIGGLVGSNGGSSGVGVISSCYSSAAVRGSQSIGGLAGRNGSGMIRSSHSSGSVRGQRKVGGLVGDNTSGTISSSYSSARVQGNSHVGGLAGYIHRSGTIEASCSTGTVLGTDNVGGLLGTMYQSGTVTSCYSTSRVHGSSRIGGLLGSFYTDGTVSSCYSTNRVYGAEDVGGLVGHTYNGSSTSKVFRGTVSSCFWDREASEQTASKGGTGLTTTQMQEKSRYLQADWDFMHETDHGSEDIWWMPDVGAPRLCWQYGYAHAPLPADHSRTTIHRPTLQWEAGGPGRQHDVYVGVDKTAIDEATPQSQGRYLGRHPAGIRSYTLPILDPDTTYYWRVDGIGPDIRRGPVWCFTAVDYVTVTLLDDFEAYDDFCRCLFFTWRDGWGYSGAQDRHGCNESAFRGNGSGATVGNAQEPFASHLSAFNESQSLPMYYQNMNKPYYSEMERVWSVPQDWTKDGADALTLYVRGETDNSQEPLYIVIEDSHGSIAMVYHANERATQSTEWLAWHIPFTTVETEVDLTAVTKIYIGVGNWDQLQVAGMGVIYIDDIQLTVLSEDGLQMTENR